LTLTSAIGLCLLASSADPQTPSMAPQLGGGIGQFDGGISYNAAPAAPVTPCAQDGLNFTKACNAVLYVVIFH
jgi:hypothetical protein